MKKAYRKHLYFHSSFDVLICNEQIVSILDIHLHLYYLLLSLLMFTLLLLPPPLLLLLPSLTLLTFVSDPLLLLLLLLASSFCLSLLYFSMDDWLQIVANCMFILCVILCHCFLPQQFIHFVLLSLSLCISIQFNSSSFFSSQAYLHHHYLPPTLLFPFHLSLTNSRSCDHCMF